MQALQLTATGSLDALQLRDLPKPVPKANEVLVEVRAAGVNPSDIKNVLGRFPYTNPPVIPGRDFAGIVVSGPAELEGKAVWGGTGKGFGFYQDGCHAQYVAVPANAVALMPESLTFAQAATFGVPYITAWDALERSQVKPGTRLLIIGAGAVAKAAQSIGTARGAEVIVAARRSDVVEQLQKEGVNAITLKENDQLPEQAASSFGGQAPEVVFDTTGFWLEAAINTVGVFGRIAVIAAPADGLVSVSALNLYRRGGSIIGINSLLYSVEDCARMLEHICETFKGNLPVPDHFTEMPLSKAIEAYRKVGEGSSEKIVLVP